MTPLAPDIRRVDDLRPLEKLIHETAAVAKHPQAPPDERHDAAVTLAKAVAPAVPRLEAMDIIKAVTRLEMLRARAQPKSGWNDPYGIFRPLKAAGGRPAPLGFQQLRQLVAHDPILSSIVFTRQRQISRLAQPSRFDHEPGFRIRLRGRPGHEMGDADRERVRWLERFVMNCGAVFNPLERERLKRDSFATFLKKVTMDTLAMDAMPVEVIPTGEGRPHGFVHVDGATVYIAPPGGFDQLDEPTNPNYELPELEDVKAVRVIDDVVYDWYAYGEIIYEVRNPRTDTYGIGYGIAESELMVRFVTNFLNATEYNAKAYEENHIPRGILNIFGDFADQDLEDLKAEVRAYLSGVNNAWNLPIMVSKDKESGAQFTRTGIEVNEMMFAKWITFLVAIHCALYGINPEEIGFESFSTKSSTLSDGSKEAQITSGMDKGYVPLKQHIQGVMNILVQAVDEEAEFVFTGDKDPKEAQEWDKLTLTFREARERQGLPATGLKILDEAPINPAMQSVYLQAVGQAAGADKEQDAPEEAQQEGQQEGQVPKGLAAIRAGLEPEQPPENAPQQSNPTGREHGES